MKTARKLLLLPLTLVAALLIYWRLLLPSSPSQPSSSPLNHDTMNSSTPLRLAILEADTPQPKTLAKFGGYTGVFTALLNAGSQLLEPPRRLDEVASVKGYDVVNDLDSYPALEEVDAILITGSRHTAFDDDPWIVKLVEYTKQAIESGRVKVVGVCFGHQIIGRAAGAKLGRSDRGWEVAVTEVELTEKGKELFQLDKMRIHQMHRDILYDFPPSSIPLGSNDICQVQGMYQPGKYITVQGHPEFTGEIISEVLFNRHAAGIFNDEVYEDAMKRAPIPHDGAVIAKAFLKFMREG